MSEILAFYESNQDFRDYLDRYCAVRGKTVEDAVQDALIIAYYEYVTAPF